MEFWRETSPKARKERWCDACGQQIEIGTRYVYMACKSDGEFFQISQHMECRAAEIALADLHGLYGGEDWIHIGDLDEKDDLLWIEENHPAAFARLRERYQHWLNEGAAA